RNEREETGEADRGRSGNADPAPDPAANPPMTPAEPEPPLDLSSSEAIRRAQIALKEQGYYEGGADGVMNPRTSTALKVFQQEHKLAETGALDEPTARSLGIMGRPTPANARSDSPSSAAPTSAQPNTSSARKDPEPDSGVDSVPANVIG